MNAWQVELMEANAAAQQWEERCAPDPAEKQMIDAAKDLKQANEYLDKAIAWTRVAADELIETPMAAKVESYEEALSEIGYALEQLQDLYSRGVRG